MYSKIVVAATLAVAPLVRATGQAVVENRCDFPVYLWSVSNTDSEMHTIDANSGNYSETYRTNPNGGGVSLKIARDQSQSSITQFEYTLDNSLWYDLSNINGYPFEDWGVSLVPSDDGCRNILCSAGVTACSDAYNVPSDNHATSVCSTESNTVLVLCSNQQSETDVSDDANNAADAAASVISSAANGSDNAGTPVAEAVVQTTPPPAAPAPADSSSSGDDSNVQTAFETKWVTVEPAAAAATAAPAADNSGPQWFGHHEADWTPKSRRHVHHPHAAHAARE